MTTTRKPSDTYTEACLPCAGTGKRHDPTDADKVNAGPFVGRCSRCSGKGFQVKVVLAPFASAVGLGAIPGWDDTQDLPDWMTG
jgi:hypothetical protein